MALDQQVLIDEEQHEASRMAFGDHLEELRRRLIYALIGPLIAAAPSLYFGRTLVGWLIEPLFRALRANGQTASTFYHSPTAPFTVYFKVSLVAALIVAAPWIVYQLWGFIAKGLYRHERNVVATIIPFSTIMAVIGVAFMYWVMLPLTLAFFVHFGTTYPAPGVAGASRPAAVVQPASPQPGAGPDAAARLPLLEADPPHPQPGQAWIKLPEGELSVFFGHHIHRYESYSGKSVQPLIELGEYISYVTMMTLGIVIAFQLPVVMLILGWLGIITPKQLSKYRKYCVWICLFLGAMFSSPDVVSMFALGIPLWALFELGLLAMRITTPKTLRQPDGE